MNSPSQVLKAAEQRCQQEAQNPTVWKELARLYFEHRNPTAAEKILRQAVVRFPLDAELAINLFQLLLRKQPAEAVEFALTVFRIPQVPEAFLRFISHILHERWIPQPLEQCRLGLALATLVWEQQPDLALGLAQFLYKLAQPEFEDPLLDLLGQVALKRGDFIAAHGYWLQLAKNFHRSGYSLRFASRQQAFTQGKSLMEIAAFEWGAAFFELSLRFPEDPAVPLHDLYYLRAVCANILLEPQKAQDYFKLANQHAPHPLMFELERLIALPYIYASQEHLEQTRLNFEQSLRAFIPRVLDDLRSSRMPELELTVSPPFLLAYQGLNDRDVLRDLGSFWQELKNLSGERLVCQHMPRHKAPYRIGIVSRYFYDHSVMQAYKGRFQQMGACEEIELQCFYLGTRVDDVTQEMADSAAQFFYLGEAQCPEAIILEQKLDLLIYTDVMMDSKSYALALHRLAPIQMLMLGHPVTSGLPDMDYYLTSEMEPQDGVEHYTETLVCITGRPPYSVPHLSPEDFLERDEIGFAQDAHIYYCPMTLFKVHPEFDALLAQILQADPKGQIYFVESKGRAYHQVLQRRFQQSIPEEASRIHFLPWMDDKKTFLNSLRLADVVLDTIHFSGGTTCPMIMGMGTPMVTWPRAYTRSRIAAMHCLNFGVGKECVAFSADDYVHKAVRIATEPQFRAALSLRLRDVERVNEALGQKDWVQEFLNFVAEAVAAYPEKTQAFLPQPEHALESRLSNPLN